ncbi:MAG: stage V sporulation protein AD [Oscillospiraceae bacterium]|nr:stage V sporulation protein AD [Oscillospiraceae bacterium]
MPEKVGSQTIVFQNDVCISSYAAVVGAKEGEGPLGNGFDKVYNDELVGEDSFEKAESRLQTTAVQTAIKKSGMTEDQIDYMFAGDLLNQCIGSAYGLKDFAIPFLGLYGACSTMALSLALASLFVESGVAKHTIAVTSSHFCSAERQFRFPLEYGGQRTPTAQWTVTGSGAAVVSCGKNGPRINAITFGKINDLGVKDINNMGAAMSPAAAETIKAFLDDTNTSPKDYDLILTGDLGKVGSDLLHELLLKDNISIAENHNDCGLMIFDLEGQDVHAGGSGCGCSASVLCSKILNEFKSGKYKNILFCATGALMSPTSTMQGQSIPSIAHLVNIVK